MLIIIRSSVQIVPTMWILIHLSPQEQRGWSFRVNYSRTLRHKLRCTSSYICARVNTVNKLHVSHAVTVSRYVERAILPTFTRTYIIYIYIYPLSRIKHESINYSQCFLNVKIKINLFFIIFIWILSCSKWILRENISFLFIDTLLLLLVHAMMVY